MNDARLRKKGRGRHLAERRSSKSRAGHLERRRIRQIEGLGTELEFESFAHGEVLEHREVKLAELRAAEGVPTEVAFKGRSRGRRATSNRTGPHGAAGKIAREEIQARVVSLERGVGVDERVPEEWLVGPVVRNRIAVEVTLLL